MLDHVNVIHTIPLNIFKWEMATFSICFNIFNIFSAFWVNPPLYLPVTIYYCYLCSTNRYSPSKPQAFYYRSMSSCFYFPTSFQSILCLSKFDLQNLAKIPLPFMKNVSFFLARSNHFPLYALMPFTSLDHKLEISKMAISLLLNCYFIKVYIYFFYYPLQCLPHCHN